MFSDTNDTEKAANNGSNNSPSDDASNTAEQTESVMDSLAPTELLRDEIDQVQKVYDIIIEFFANYTFQLIGAVIIFLIGYYVAGKVGNAVLRVCEKNKLDITLSRFISNTSKMLVVVLVTIISLGKLGISVTPFIATIGALSLGAGLALQGLLANYAAGFNIILIRPFVVGDTITVQGVTGIVREVLLAYTILTDEDDVEIMIPNKHIVGEVLHNSKENSLLELCVGIDYSHNPNRVVELIKAKLETLDFVSSEKAPLVGIDEFADSSINIGIRFWTPTVNLYASKYAAYKEIYDLLDSNKIKIPFPQRDVHLISNEKASA